MVNILEVINKGDEDLSLLVKLATDTGEIPRGIVRYTIPHGEQQDIVLNNISGFSSDHYGVIAIESNHEEYDARVTMYAPSTDRGNIPFSYSVPVSNKRGNKTYMSYNSYNPSRSALDQGLLVANWVSLANTGDRQAAFELVYYNQAGEEISRKAVELPALGRVDMQAGHEFPGGKSVGLIAVEPNTEGSTYVAMLTRYALKSSACSNNNCSANPSSNPSYSYAVGIPADNGSAEKQYVGIGGTAESMSVIELAAVSPERATGTFKWYSSEGTLQAQESFSLNPNAQRHIVVPATSLGSIEVSSESGKLLIGSVVYHYDEDDASVAGVEYSPGAEPFGLSLYGSYNLHLGMNNWLRLFNTSAERETLTVRYLRARGSSEQDQYNIPPRGRLDLGIHERAMRNTYGLVEVTTSSPGVIAAQVVRTRSSSSNTGFEFTSATGVR